MLGEKETSQPSKTDQQLWNKDSRKDPGVPISERGREEIQAALITGNRTDLLLGK